jgi:hypothetical protein
VRADRDFFIYWSRRYLDELPAKLRSEEENLLNAVGPAVRQRGFYTLAELDRVNRWKLPTQRNRKLLTRNSSAEIEAITKIALAAPEHLKIFALELLYGVSDPVASALLMFPFPDRHTVIDFRVARALEALDQEGQLSDRLLWRWPAGRDSWLPPYPPYLAACQRLADRLEIPLRDLDRALWQWHKEKMPRSTPRVGPA